MDYEVSVEDLKNKVKKFCEDRDWDQFHNPKDLAIGISTEAAELLDIFRFKSQNEIKHIIENSEQRNRIGEELSDVFYFILRFAQMFNFDLSQELAKKLEINDKKYPVHTAKGSNKKYNE
jgi:NTP pyrophosphatase (non-canonical NTP hydrolase)